MKMSFQPCRRTQRALLMGFWSGTQGGRCSCVGWQWKGGEVWMCGVAVEGRGGVGVRGGSGGEVRCGCEGTV